MSYIIKRKRGCRGAGCLECEKHLAGFVSRNGGITVQDDNERAEMAAASCPEQLIEIEEYRGNTSK